jgi:hypothetical protein
MAASTMNDAQLTRGSLDLLEVRLRRLEFLLSGSSNLDGVPNGVVRAQRSEDTLPEQLRSLQASLDQLRKGDGVAGEMIRDVEAIQAKYPELFGRQHVPIEETSTQASVVLSNATLYPETASRLSSLQSLQIPPAESSAMLVGLARDIESCQQEQNKLDDQVQELRQRSARCLEWWVKTGVVGMGNLWEDWEDRMIQLERQVSRFERQRKDEEGYL